MAIINENGLIGICLGGEETLENILTAKLKQGRRKFVKLIVTDLFVCPILFGIIMISLWVELDYPNYVSTSGIYSLARHLDTTCFVAYLILWIVSHICNMYLLLAVAGDNLRYCRTYGSTLGPVLQILTIFFFSLLMWASLNSLPNYNLPKFVLVVGCVIAIVANFYNYFLNVMAEHFQLLTRFKIMKYKMTQPI